jgi:DNA-binding NarL/FixJ family response regulator
MEGRVSIFILSSNRIFRESVERMIRKKPDLDLKGARSIQADSTHEIVSSGAEILMTDSLQFILETKWRAQSTTERCRVKVVLVAMDDDKKQFLSAVKRGVLGYVLQDAPAIEVIDAIRTVGRGEAICPQRFTRVLFDCVASESLDLPNARTRQQWGLTRREQQLIPMIGRRMTNKEIAARFGLSEQTVKNHLHRILHKVGVAHRLEAFKACQTESIAL